MSKARSGINPVTIRGKDNKAVSILRAYIGVGDELKRWMTLAIYNEADKEVLGDVIVDEDYFLDGLYHLYPDGSQDAVEASRPAPVNEDVLEALRYIYRELSQHTESSLPTSPVYHALNKARDTLALLGAT